MQETNVINHQTDATGNGCDLNNLEESLCNDSDELLRQLSENTFELEQFFQDFPATEIKVVSIFVFFFIRFIPSTERPAFILGGKQQ